VRKIDPRLKKVVRELFGDMGTDDDHAYVMALLEGMEVPHMKGKGRLCYNGEWTPFGHNRLIDDGTKILTSRTFDSSTYTNVDGVPGNYAVLTAPRQIVLGTGGDGTANSYSASYPNGVQTEITGEDISGPPSGFTPGTAWPTSEVSVSSSGSTYIHDTITFATNWGTLALPLNFNWLPVSPKTVYHGGTLAGQCIITLVP